jgi:hypothetical protein
LAAKWALKKGAGNLKCSPEIAVKPCALRFACAEGIIGGL